MKQLKKRSQITAIMIVVVILVVLTGLYFAVFKNKALDSTEEVVPLDVLPVHNFVTSCMKKTSYEAITKLASHGGYVNTDSIFVTNNIITSEGIQMFDGYKVPFWYYTDSNGLLSSRMPQLEGGRLSVKSQIEDYIQQNILKCLNNFDSLSTQYLIEYKEPVVNVNLDNNVRIELAMPTKVTDFSNGSVKNIDKYVTTLDFDLKEMFDVGSMIVDYEINYNVFEHNVLNLISLYSGIDEPLPPMSHYELGSNKFNYWMKSKVQEVIENDILSFIRMSQVVNSEGFNPVQVDYDIDSQEEYIMQGIYNSMHFILGQNDEDKAKVYDYRIEFEYPQTGTYLNIGDSQLIKPKNAVPMKNFLLDAMGFSLYDYSFDYDLQFPVLVTVTKENAYLGNDVSLKFAFEGNIKNNVPLKAGSDLAMTGATATQTQNIMFENPMQYSDKKLKIHTVDAYTTQPIEADVYYRCGSEVVLGNTVIKGSYSELDSRLPYCMFGGRVVAEKDGYQNGVADFNPDDRGDDLELKMWPIVEKEIELRTISSLDSPSQIYSSSAVIKDSEKALLVLTREKEWDEEIAVPLIGMLDFNYNKADIDNAISDNINFMKQNADAPLELFDFEGTELEESTKLELIPGKYTVRAFLFYGGNLTLPEKKDKICPCVKILGACLCKQEEVTYPEQTFTTFPLGEIDIDFNIDESLYDSEKLVVYVPKKTLPVTWGDFEDYESDSVDSDLLVPELR